MAQAQAINVAKVNMVLDRAFRDPSAFDVDKDGDTLTISMSPETRVWLVASVVNALADEYEVELDEEPELAGGEEYVLTVYDTDPLTTLSAASKGDRLTVRFDHQARTEDVTFVEHETVTDPDGYVEGTYEKFVLSINGACSYDVYVDTEDDDELLDTMLNDVRYKHLESTHIQTKEEKMREHFGHLVHAREVENGR